MDEWDVAELACRIPFYPEHSVKSYKGFYFKLK